MSDKDQDSTVKLSDVLIQALARQDVMPMDDAPQEETPAEIKKKREKAFSFLSVIGFTPYETESILKWASAVDAITEQALRGFARNFKQAVFSGHGITIFGKTGSGKSTIAAALAFHGLVQCEIFEHDSAKSFIHVIQFSDLVEMLVSSGYGPNARIILIDNVRVLSGAELRKNLFENYVAKRDSPKYSTWLSLQTDFARKEQFSDAYPSVFSRLSRNFMFETKSQDFRAGDTLKLMEIIMPKEKK